MAEKTTPKRADSGVMANLPATRPNRLSRRARAEQETAESPGVARPRAAAKAATAAEPKRASSRAAAPEASRPRAVRAGAPELREPARKAVAGRQAAADGPRREQSPVELAGTVVKAAGEVAQIGATVAGQLIRRAAGRLPKP